MIIMSLSPGKPWPKIKAYLSRFLLLLCLWWSIGALRADQEVFSFDSFSVHAQQELSVSMQRIALLLDDRIAELQMKVGIYPAEKPDIYIVQGEAEYQKLSLGKAEIVEFSDAFFSSSENRIYIRSGEQIHQNYLKILLHEYIHWYLEELFTDAPLWFHEGMATYHSGQLGYDRYLLYIRESFLGKKSDLYRMSYRYPTSREDWPMFYVSSAMALRFMEEKHPLAWQRFWDTVSQSHRQGQKIRFNQAFFSSYGLSMYDFTLQFERYSKRQGYLYLIVALNSVIFLCLPFVMLLVAAKRRRKMRALPELELPDEPSEKEAESTADDEEKPEALL